MNIMKLNGFNHNYGVGDMNNDKDVKRVKEDILLLEKILKEFEELEEFDLNKDEKIIRIIDLSQRYCKDAQYFLDKGDVLTAFGAVNYAHGMIDALRILKGKI